MDIKENISKDVCGDVENGAIQCKTLRHGLSGLGAFLGFRPWKLTFTRKVGRLIIKMKKPKFPLSRDQKYTFRGKKINYREAKNK